MEDARFTSAAHEVRFRNAVKIGIDGECREEDCAKLVMEKVLAVCGVKGEELLCMAEYRNQGVVEVVFNEYAVYKEFKRKWNAEENKPEMEKFTVEFLHRNPWKLVTVMMYNPYVTTSEVTEFLKLECEEVEFVKLIDNSVGVWSGKRLFRCRFYVNEYAVDHVEHIKQTFQIGRNKGFLKYSGMPPYCWKCSDRGHTTAQCDLLRRCKNCMGLGHTAENCTAPKKCTHCQSSEHLYEECPNRVKTFAEKVAGTKISKKMNLPEDEDVLRQVVEMEKELEKVKELEQRGSSISETEQMESNVVVVEGKPDGTTGLVEGGREEMECQMIKEARPQEDPEEDIGNKRRKVVQSVVEDTGEDLFAAVESPDSFSWTMELGKDEDEGGSVASEPVVRKLQDGREKDPG